MTDELEKLAMAATPGPWLWETNKYGIQLYSPPNGKCTVMDFARRGMHGAQPRFSNRTGQPLGGVMLTADEIGDLNTNADASYIAAANPSAILEIIAEVKQLRVALEEIRDLALVVVATTEDTPARRRCSRIAVIAVRALEAAHD